MNYDIIRALVKRKREEKGLTLDELAAATNISKATLSRFESRTTKKINLKSLHKLYKVLNIDENQFEGIIQKPKDEPLTIGFAYAIWSAPIILSLYDLMEGKLNLNSRNKSQKRGVEFISFGTYEETKYKDSNNSPFIFDKSIPKELLNARTFKEHYLKENNNWLYTYTAKHLFEFLEIEEIDVIAIAGKLTEKKKNSIVLANFLKVANQGCELVIFSNKEKKYDTNSSHLDEIINDSFKYLEIQFLDALNFSSKNENLTLNQFWIKSFYDCAEILINRNNLDPEHKTTLKRLTKSIGYKKLDFDKKREITQLIVIILKEHVTVFDMLSYELFKVILVYAQNTIADDHFDRFLFNHYQDKVIPTHICFAAEEIWDDHIKEFIFPLINENSEYHTEHVLPFFFLGWEPKISHLRNSVAKVYELYDLNLNNICSENFNLSKSFGSEKDSLFTFDLVAKDNADWLYDDLLFDFIYSLKENIDNLRSEITELKSKENSLKLILSKMDISGVDKKTHLEKHFNSDIESSEVINKIAFFLALTPIECYKSLVNLEFDHWVNQEWIKKYITNKKI
nr:helix-turn-helix domain-containing protein [uncultured Psychroserpens sp.]